MAEYNDVKIRTSELGDRILLDDVDSETSINPRSSISSEYVKECKESILGYLSSGVEFTEAWNQVPEAVETDQDGVYLLVSGYHTITALKNAISEIESNPNKEVTKGEGIKYSDIETNFDVVVRVYPSGKYDYRETARYLAAFSNVHGQPLTNEEKRRCAYNALSTMNLQASDTDPDFRPHVDDRRLAAQLGVSMSLVWTVRQELIKERFGPKEDDGSKMPSVEDEDAEKQKRSGVEKVDTSTVRIIGSGSESVYLYYFPTYKLNFKNLDDSHETLIYKCNIGSTRGYVKDRVSQQIGQQLPEKPILALIIKTDNCTALETEIHDELKRRECWLDPKAGADVVGVEWFLTNSAEVEEIVKSIDEKRKKEDAEELEEIVNILGLNINDLSERQRDGILKIWRGD